MNLEELRKFNMRVKKEIAKIEGIEIMDEMMKRLQKDGHSVKSLEIEKYDELHETIYVIYMQLDNLNKCIFAFSDFRMFTTNKVFDRRYFTFEDFGEWVAMSSYENDIGNFHLNKQLYKFFPTIDLFKYFVRIFSARFFYGNSITLDACKFDETDIEEDTEENFGDNNVNYAEKVNYAGLKDLIDDLEIDLFQNFKKKELAMALEKYKIDFDDVFQTNLEWRMRYGFDQIGHRLIEFCFDYNFFKDEKRKDNCFLMMLLDDDNAVVSHSFEFSNHYVNNYNRLSSTNKSFSPDKSHFPETWNNDIIKEFFFDIIRVLFNGNGPKNTTIKPANITYDNIDDLF